MCRAFVRLAMLFAGIILLCGSPATAQTWPQQNYAAYRGMILNAANRFRDAIVRYRAPLGFDARIAQHSVIAAAAGDPECFDPTNFAYYDLNGHVVMCVESFVHFFEFEVENLKLTSIRRDLITQDDIAEYGRRVAQFYMAHQSGRDTPGGHCAAEYWVFLVRNHLPREACFAQKVAYLPAYLNFMKVGGIYRDVLNDTLGELRAAGVDTARMDLSEFEKYKTSAAEDQLKNLSTLMYGEYFSGSISAVYFHELGHFYLNHGKDGACVVIQEENAAEQFSRDLIDKFSKGEYNDVDVGQAYFLNSYYAIYLEELIDRLEEIESSRGPNRSIAELPTELRGLGVVKLGAALQGVADEPAMAAYISHQASEPIDVAEISSVIDRLVALRGCSGPGHASARR
ncbi:hypothetical protein U1839_15040 [Sphingomonas sp. RT2P30]|uniref:hypothetical protein n=1 Tax=Parasphingomonas halimpatiens TaxID=3096162 RepID=UPI002FC92DA7